MAPVSAPALSKVNASTKTGNEAEAVTFERSFSDAGVLDTHALRCNFGDGIERLNELGPSHVYKDNGTYKVTFDVTDKDGDVGSANIDVEINNLSPTAS